MLAAPLDRDRWPFFALAMCAAMLAAAHAFERIGRMYPCPLCLTQREIYWAAGAIAALGALIAWRWPRPRLLTAVDLLLGVAFLTGFGVAGYHALVEWGVFAAPPGCAAASEAALAGSLLDQLARPMAVGSCGEATGRVLGLSMAGWNAVISLALAAASIFAALRGRGVDAGGEPTP
jgi:disulfide bond formation protein DsbB